MSKTTTVLPGSLSDLKLANSERTIFWQFNLRNLVEEASDSENPASMKLAKQVIESFDNAEAPALFALRQHIIHAGSQYCDSIGEISTDTGEQITELIAQTIESPSNLKNDPQSVNRWANDSEMYNPLFGTSPADLLKLVMVEQKRAEVLDNISSMSSAQGTELCQAIQEVLEQHSKALENTLADLSRDIVKAVDAIN